MSDRCTQAYVEYNLACEPLKYMRGQIVVDFTVEHRINDKHGLEVGYVTCTPWKLYFDGSVCDDGQEISVALISLNGAILSSQTDRKRIAQIIKLSMKRSYLAWNFYNLWA